MDDHDIAYDDRSERDYLNHNRKQIKKSAYLRNRLKTKAWFIDTSMNSLSFISFIFPLFNLFESIIS